MMNTLELPLIVHLIFAVGFFPISDCGEKSCRGNLKLGIEA